MNFSRLCLRAVDFTSSAKEEESDGRNLEGYAAVFDTPTMIRSWEGQFNEQISRGAFKKTIKERTPVLQFDHGRDARTGTVPIGAIQELREDESGLFVKAKLFDNPVVDPIRQAIEGGAIGGMSFRFEVVRDEWHDASGKKIRSDSELSNLLWDPGERGPLQRTIKEVKLFEAGPVVFPAYAETSVAVRAADELTDEERAAIAAEYARTAVLDDEDDEERVLDKNGDPAKPYGDVPYADPGYQQDGKKRYPLDTAEHVKAAWSYINQEKNASQYTPEQLAKVKNKIKAAAKKFGIEISEGSGSDQAGSKPNAKEPAAEKKSSELPAEDAAHHEGTSESGEPEDAVREDTSSGHEEKNRATAKPVVAQKSRKESVPTMRTVEELRARLAEIDERLAEIGGEYADREMPEERQTEWDELDTEHKELRDSIAKIEERAERLRARAASQPKSRERGFEAPAVVRTQRETDLYDIDELRKSAYSGDDFVLRVRENAMRAVEKSRFPGVRNKEAAQEQALSLLDEVDTENGELAKRMLLTGSPLYHRAFGKTVRALGTAGLEPEEARAMSLGADAGGGYAVPFQLDPTVILSNAGAINPLRKLARHVQIVGKEWQGITSDGITVSRAAEAAEVGDNSPTLVQPTVRPTRVHGFVPFSIEIDQDWGQLQAEMTRMLADAREREEATSFVTGNGTPPNPSGVVATLSGNTVTTAGAAGSFSAADVYAMEDAMAPRFRPNAQWLASKTIYNKVRQFADADGHDLWERIGAGQPPELLGYSAHEASAMSTSVATGQKILLFGDFQNFLIVDRVGMSVELVPHLFHTDNNRPTGQRGLYAIWRNSSKILVHSAFKLLVVG